MKEILHVSRGKPGKSQFYFFLSIFLF